MRIGVLSDIHANLEALDAVLEHLDRDAPDLLVCLGDFVGYGPDPNACIERIRPRLAAAVLGNHDAAAVGLRPIDDFNLMAQQAIAWTQGVLSDGSRAYLAALPEREVREGLLLVHGSPRQPVEEYVLDSRRARASFVSGDFRMAVVGHTHQPAIFEEVSNRVSTKGLLPGVPFALKPTHRYIVNVGSVGQPRDGDPRAAWVLVDTEAPAATLHRVAYPIHATQAKMEAAGLPAPLIERLVLGR
jgi:predicted phosphodiesterase